MKDEARSSRRTFLKAGSVAAVGAAMSAKPSRARAETLALSGGAKAVVPGLCSYAAIRDNQS